MKEHGLAALIYLNGDHKTIACMFVLLLNCINYLDNYRFFAVQLPGWEDSVKHWAENVST